MPELRLREPAAHYPARTVDRRTLLVSAAGTVAGVALSGPLGASARAASKSARAVDPGLARQLHRVLRAALRDPSVHAPGAILHVDSPTLGRWSGAAGLGRVTPAVAMRVGDRFRAGAGDSSKMARSSTPNARRRSVSDDIGEVARTVSYAASMLASIVLT